VFRTRYEGSGGHPLLSAFIGDPVRTDRYGLRGLHIIINSDGRAGSPMLAMYIQSSSLLHENPTEVRPDEKLQCLSLTATKVPESGLVLAIVVD
jgi:hypothetical protein